MFYSKLKTILLLHWQNWSSILMEKSDISTIRLRWILSSASPTSLSCPIVVLIHVLILRKVLKQRSIVQVVHGKVSRSKQQSLIVGKNLQCPIRSSMLMFSAIWDWDKYSLHIFNSLSKFSMLYKFPTLAAKDLTSNDFIFFGRILNKEKAISCSFENLVFKARIKWSKYGIYIDLNLKYNVEKTNKISKSQ